MEKRPLILSSWPIRRLLPLDDSVCTVEFSLLSPPSRRSTRTTSEKIEIKRELRKLIEGIYISCEKEVRLSLFLCQRSTDVKLQSSSLLGRSRRLCTRPTFKLDKHLSTPAKDSSAPTPPSTSPERDSQSDRSRSTSRTE